MSEPQNDTDAGPTAQEWVVERSGNWWMVKEYHTDSTGRYIYEGRSHQGRKDARLIAAAGTAAHELPDEYDAVAAVEALPELLDNLEALAEINSRWRAAESDDPEDMPEQDREETFTRMEALLRTVNALASAEGREDG